MNLELLVMNTSSSKLLIQLLNLLFLNLQLFFYGLVVLIAAVCSLQKCCHKHLENRNSFNYPECHQPCYSFSRVLHLHIILIYKSSHAFKAHTYAY